MNWPEAFAVVGVIASVAAMAIAAMLGKPMREKWRPTGWRPPTYRTQHQEIIWKSPDDLMQAAEQAHEHETSDEPANL